MVKLPKNRPNFVFIFADDLGWGDLACYGNHFVETPCLDKMAARGTRFSQFYVNGPMCSPSRASALTGHFPARDGIHFWMNPSHNKKLGMPDFLDPDVYTLPRLLQKSGYATAHFGKWHLGEGFDAPEVLKYGFDETRIICQGNGPKYGVPPNHHQGTEMIVDSTIDFISRNLDEPFYVNVWPRDVHAALDPDEEALARYRHLMSISSYGKFKTAMQIYYAAITEMDKQIGRLIDWIDSQELSQDTLVVFSSDNGPESIYVAHAGHHAVGSPGPFRGRKRSLYEGGVRMPFIVQWKNHTPANRVDNTSVISGVDLLPTFCSLAGVVLPEDLKPDGEDVSACFLGAPFERTKDLMWEWRFPETNVSPYLDRSPMLAIRQGKWKLLLNPDHSRIELYEIPKQPSELDSLAGKCPDIVRRLSRKVLAWQRTLPPGPIAEDAGSDAYPWPQSITITEKDILLD